MGVSLGPAGKTPLDARATALLLQGRLVPELGQPRVRDDDVTDGIGRNRQDLADIGQLSDDRGFNLVLLDTIAEHFLEAGPEGVELAILEDEREDGGLSRM